LSFACDESYRKTEAKINRIRWQKDDITQSRTIANVVEREGLEIQRAIEDKTVKILEENGFDKNGKLLELKDNIKVLPESDYVPEALISQAVLEYNDGKDKELQIEISELHETFENPFTSTNASIDEVGVKKQKEEGRSKYSVKKDGKEYVRNTVVHVQKGKGRYILNKLGIIPALKILMAFLLYNNLLEKGALVFFVDGARDLQAGIKEMFGWVPFKIILDWHHLEEKCKMQLSLGLKGREVRNSVLAKVTAYLWVGKVDKAVEVLRQVEEKHIKSKDAIENLIGYFDRNWSYIPCYALRKELGLRNSSNRGEKANDLTVSDRQKHNGMSWSNSGSSSLASVITLHQNGEQMNWLLKRDIDFKLIKKEQVA